MTDPQNRAMLCDRTREWLALGQDGEVAEFEPSLMQAHLDRCAPCRRFGAELSAITQALRSAPLESLSQPVTLTLRRPVLAARRLQAVAAAAVLLVLAAGIGSLYGALQGSSGPPSSSQVAHGPMLAALGSSDPLLRELRIESLRPQGPLPLGAVKPVLQTLV